MTPEKCRYCGRSALHTADCPAALPAVIPPGVRAYWRSEARIYGGAMASTWHNRTLRTLDALDAVERERDAYKERAEKAERVVHAAGKGFARSQCGSCDAGLPMNCTCNEMDVALAALADTEAGE